MAVGYSSWPHGRGTPGPNLETGDGPSMTQPALRCTVPADTNIVTAPSTIVLFLQLRLRARMTRAELADPCSRQAQRERRRSARTRS